MLSTIIAAHLTVSFWSLRSIDLSLDQEINATAPLSTAVFGFLIAGSVESFWTYLTLLPVVAGIILACDFEPHVKWAGVAVSVSAVSFQGCKNTVQVRHSAALSGASAVAPLLPLACQIRLKKNASHVLMWVCGNISP